MIELLSSFSTYFLATLLAVLLGYFVINKSNQEKKHKHGAKISFYELPMPPAYPVVGHLTKLASSPHITLAKWSETYGSLFRIKMGFQDALIVSNLPTIRTALLKHAVAFAGRPAFDALKLLSEGLGLAFSSYSPPWEHQKQVAETVLKLYTTGKDPEKRFILETSLNKHANKLVDSLLEMKDEQGNVNPIETVIANAANAICEVCFGRDFQFDDPEFCKLLKSHKNFDRSFGASQIVHFWPFLKHVPVVSRNFKKTKIFMDQLLCFTVEMLKSHLQEYDENNLKDITDYLWNQIKIEKKTDERESTTGFETTPSTNAQINKNVNPIGFINSVVEKEGLTTEEKLVRKRILYCINDLLGAGFDTAAAIIHYALIYMAVFTETQEKMREEMEDAMTPDEEPSYRLHSSRCPYIVAWIYELIRHSSVVAILLPHLTTQDVILEDYFIPKGMLVYFNAYQVHYNPKLWKDPEKFQPERFLNNTDQLDQKNVSNLLAWGLGKRKCPGAEISKYELFIFICTILRRMKVEQSKPGIEPVLPWPANFGITLKPTDFSIKITKRT